MRVLLVAPQPFLTIRGSPLNILRMCRVLTAAGHEVHLATFPMGDDVEMPGLTIHRCLPVPGIRHVPIGFSKRKVVLDGLLAGTVLRLLLTHRFDLVHAVEEAVFLALPLAALRRLPVVYDMDSILSDHLHYGGTVRRPVLLRQARRLEAFAIRRSVAVISVCDALTDFAIGVRADTPVHQIEDAPIEGADRVPDPDEVAALRAGLELAGRPVIVYTGNFQPYQGLDLLLDSLVRVRREHPDVACVIVGGSPDDVERLAAEAEVRGVGESVRLPGRVEPESIPEYLALADGLVSPRREGENTPLKLYTYMASGKPIIATDLPIHTQVLGPETAILVRTTPAGVAEGIRRVIEEPAAVASIGTASRDLLEREYSPEAFARKLNAAYDAIGRAVGAPRRDAEPAASVPDGRAES